MTDHNNLAVRRSAINGPAANLGLVALLLVVLGCSCPAKLAELANKKEATPTPTRPTPMTSTTPSITDGDKGEYDLTKEKFKKLSIGQPRADVERILGGKGKVISNSTGGGVRFSVNQWDGDGFKSIILSFKNDKIMTKSQVGLD